MDNFREWCFRMLENTLIIITFLLMVILIVVIADIYFEAIYGVDLVQWPNKMAKHLNAR